MRIRDRQNGCTTEHMNCTQNKPYYTRSALQTDTKPSPGAGRTHQQKVYQLHRHPRNTSEDSVRLSLKLKQVLKKKKNVSQKSKFRRQSNITATTHAIPAEANRSEEKR